MKGLFCLLIVLVTPQWAAAQGTTPFPAVTVTGPVKLTTAVKDPAHGYSYNSTPVDLAKYGYVEEEFFIEGKANSYDTPAGLTGTVKDANHPFKTRMLVRRPKSASKFNGTVIVEWYNVSQGHDGEYDWFQSAEHLVRSGYAWAGVSTQRVGVNSLHHQALDAIGRALRVVAYSDDDLVEGVEVEDCSFALGVQWHPELLRHRSEHLALFRALVDAARSNGAR